MYFSPADGSLNFRKKNADPEEMLHFILVCTLCYYATLHQGLHPFRDFQYKKGLELIHVPIKRPIFFAKAEKYEVKLCIAFPAKIAFFLHDQRHPQCPCRYMEIFVFLLSNEYFQELGGISDSSVTTIGYVQNVKHVQKCKDFIDRFISGGCTSLIDRCLLKFGSRSELKPNRSTL